MKTISIINLKGGVAKTVSAINIAHILAEVHGKRVLLIDNDKQGNTSKFFDLHSDERPSIAELLTDASIEIDAVIRKTNYKGLEVLPANMNLLAANKDVLLDESRQQHTILKRAMEPVAHRYDYCVIDNAPDFVMSVINALAITDDVMIPIKIDKFAFDGLNEIQEHLQLVRGYNPGLQLKGCFITMYQKNSVNKQGGTWLQGNTDYPIFNTMIRRTVKVDETTFSGKPLLDYAKNSTAAKDYISLVSEYLSI